MVVPHVPQAAAPPAVHPAGTRAGGNVMHVLRVVQNAQVLQAVRNAPLVIAPWGMGHAEACAAVTSIAIVGAVRIGVQMGKSGMDIAASSRED